MTTTEQPIDPAKLERQKQRDEEDRKHYQIAYDFIKSNALKGKKFEEAAELIHVSKFHFHRNFRRLFGITPKQFAASVQIEAAKEMLLNGIPAAQVAKDCGFAHQSHLTARFRQFVKQSPMRWLRSEKMRREAAAKQVH